MCPGKFPLWWELQLPTTLRTLPCPAAVCNNSSKGRCTQAFWDILGATRVGVLRGGLTSYSVRCCPAGGLSLKFNAKWLQSFLERNLPDLLVGGFWAFADSCLLSVFSGFLELVTIPNPELGVTLLGSSSRKLGSLAQEKCPVS